jgi:molybdopterin-guanine dinucleotide biosynthesis protein A
MTGPAKSNLHGSKPSGIVLAGGQSRRLGRDKASEQLSGEALIRRVIHLVSPLTSETNVVMANLARGETLPLTQMESVAVDIYPGCGFLRGISRGCQLPTHTGLVVACGRPLT